MTKHLHPILTAEKGVYAPTTVDDVLGAIGPVMRRDISGGAYKPVYEIAKFDEKKVTVGVLLPVDAMHHIRVLALPNGCFELQKCKALPEVAQIMRRFVCERDEIIPMLLMIGLD